MPFKITGQIASGLIAESRVQPGSAAALAQQWIERKVRNVRIKDNAGRSYGLDDFRLEQDRRGTLFTPF